MAEKRPDAFRRETVKIVLWAIPVGAAAGILGSYFRSFSDNPWPTLAVLLPLIGAVYILARPLVRERRLLLGGGFLSFFLVYCALFTIVAGTEFLSGKRVPLAGYEGGVPSNFLGLGRFGDWHYWLTPQAPRDPRLLIVTLPSFAGQPIAQSRRAHAALIKTALDSDAKGIAFDYHLWSSSDADSVLCWWIGRAEASALPVIYGYQLNERNGRLVRAPLPDSLEHCISDQRLGSLTGYRELDEKIRIVPLFVARDRDLPSLSYRIAEHLVEDEVDLPKFDLLQFTKPREGIPTVAGTFQGTLAQEDKKEWFRDRFVMVGSYRPQDRHHTPFGDLEGVMIHAYAAHSLQTGHYIRRLDKWWIFPMIFVLCYVLTAKQASGGGWKAMLKGAIVLSLAVLVAAAGAIHFSLLWVDVIYPLTAVWLLTGLLVGGARLQAGRLSPGTLPAEPDANGKPSEATTAEPHDVFLSHNAKDKDLVRRLKERLEQRGLRVWLDESELIPGRMFQEGLEEVIKTVRSAAVLVGKDGLGPWEIPEMRACLGQCVERQLPVIPVLLPDVPSVPDLPIFLRQFTWVDLRSGLSKAGIDRLEWGITGIKPVALKKPKAR